MGQSPITTGTLIKLARHWRNLAMWQVGNYCFVDKQLNGLRYNLAQITEVTQYRIKVCILAQKGGTAYRLTFSRKSKDEIIGDKEHPSNYKGRIVVIQPDSFAIFCKDLLLRDLEIAIMDISSAFYRDIHGVADIQDAEAVLDRLGVLRGWELRDRPAIK